MERRDLYNLKEQAEKAKKRVSEAKIRKEDKRLILEFLEKCEADGLSPSRVAKYARKLVTISEGLEVGFRKAKEKDVTRLLASLNRKGYSPWTRRDYIITLKKFYRWLHKGKLPDFISQIRSRIKLNETKLPEDLLTEDEIKAMIKVARTARDKAFVAVLYESAGRIAEVLNLKIKDISTKGNYTAIVVSGKTGMRRVLLVMADPYLRMWLNEHPNPEERETYVWIDMKGKPLGYGAASKILKRLAERAGIRKRVHPHLLRHSRLTFLAGKLTEYQLRAYAGWTADSEMASVYVHMSGRDLDRVILGVYGLAPKDEKEEVKPLECPRCGAINPDDAKFCYKCGLALDISTAEKMQEWEKIKNEFLTSKKFKKLREEFLRGL